MKDNRRVTTKSEWLCADCGKDTYILDRDFYMVTTELWKKYGVGKRMLCVDCMETRLGHKLTKDDLSYCPVNTIFNEYTINILNENGNQM